MNRPTAILLILATTALAVWLTNRFFRKPRLIAPLTGVSVGLIVAGLLYIFANPVEVANFQDDVAFVQRLCATQGGDKIYRTVDDVEGVFQVKMRPPDADLNWADQYGMPDPWGREQLDSAAPAIPIGGREGYWFLEQQNGAGHASGVPYSRRFSQSTDLPALRVSALKSRYGYEMRDISTREMRSRWIAGGQIRILDLKSGEVLAERTGFFRAVGPRHARPWAGVAGTDHVCPKTEYLDSFLLKVLRPTKHQPTDGQLNSLKEEK